MLPKIFRGKIVNVAEVNQWRCLEQSVQWTVKTHLVLDSDKPVLQKIGPVLQTIFYMTVSSKKLTVENSAKVVVLELFLSFLCCRAH